MKKEISFNVSLNTTYKILEQSPPDFPKKELLTCAYKLTHATAVHILAIGNTTPIALDLSFRLSRFGVQAFSSSISEYYLNNVSLGKETDVVIALSGSGTAKQYCKLLILQKILVWRSYALPQIKILLWQESPTMFSLAMKNSLFFKRIKKSLFHIWLVWPLAMHYFMRLKFYLMDKDTHPNSNIKKTYG